MEVRFDLWFDRSRRFRPPTLVADAILAIVLGAVSALITSTASVAAADPDVVIARPDSVVDWIVHLVPSAAVAFRRRNPTAAVIVGGVGQAVLWSLAQPDYFLATAVLLYSTAAAPSRLSRRVAIVMAGALTSFTALGWLSGKAPFYAVAIVGLFSAAALALGTTTASRHAYIAAVEARARETERSTAADRRRAVIEERNRIARDLHDVVAHGLSVIVVQAAAAQRILDRDPEGARSSLNQIEQTGRNALSEMRQVLSVLRSEPGEEWRPAPGLDALDELVSDLGRTGLEVDLERRGRGSEPLPTTIDVTAYRIVQESLTNVLKHGGPRARATVRIDRRPHELAVAVTDDGRGASADDRGGHGLSGMRERVQIFGGRFSAGPRLGGGFAVEVTLPVERAATP